MNKLYIFLLMCLLTVSLAAQQAFIVKGIVTDEKDNSPMVGVAVAVKGTTNGISTDSAGGYELKVPLGSAILSFTYIGYQERVEYVTSYKDAEVHVINPKMTDMSKELDIVVVSGNKVEKKLGEQTQSIEVMKGENITNSAQGLQEAMNKVPGVNMIGKTISIRGGSGFADVTSNRTLVLLDDVPLVSPENGSVRWETMPTEAIEQLEIVKGPATVTNGAQALNALVNVRTINPDKDSAFNKVYANYGAYFPFQDKTWTWFWKKAGSTKIPPMFGSLAYVHSRRYGDVDVVFDGAYQRNKGYTSFNKNELVRTYLKLRYIPHKFPNLSIGGNINFCYEKYDDFFLYRNYNDTITGPGIKPTYNSQVLVPSDSNIIKLYAFNVNPYITYYDKFGSRHSFKTSYYYVQSDNNSGDSSKAHKLYLEYIFTRKFKKADADLAAGVRYSYKKIESVTFGNKNAQYAAAYGQVEKRFDKRFTIKIGISLEFNKLDTVSTKNDLTFLNALSVRDSTHRITSPIKPVVNVGLNYKLTEGTFLRASFGQGYRFADIAEQFVFTPRSGVMAVPNPSLKPESSWSAEVGLKQGMKFSRWIFYADVAGYVSRYNNLIEFVTISQTQLPTGILQTIKQAYPTYQYGPFEQAQNISHAQVWGVEASAIGTGAIFGVPLNFLIGYNYMDPKNLDYNPNDHSGGSNSHQYLYYRMRHSAKLDAQTTYKGFIIGVTCVYVGHLLQLDQIASLDKIKDWVNAHGTKGDFILDARVGYNYRNRLTATLIAKNITNRAYTLRPGFIEAPASLILQLTYQWGRIFSLAKKA
jgi:outer membrane receptor protein involved in Fe transport